MSRNAYMKWDEIKSPHFGFKWCFLCSGGLNMMISDQIIQKNKKNSQKTPKKRKNANKLKIALHCTAMHSSEMPQLLTPDGSNKTHNDPG